MALVAPSILSADFSALGEEVRQIVAAGADWVHVDVMDGHFVPNLTFGPVVLQSVAPLARGALVDVHLMIEHPDQSLQAYRDAGADLITVHAEATRHLHRSVQAIKCTGAKAGVALNPHTHESVLEYVLEDLDLVLAMTVNPGFGGQSMVEAVLRKVSRIRELAVRRGLTPHIEVDGGVKPHNAWRFVDAGADVLVSGSGVFGAADRGEAIRALQRADRPTSASSPVP